MAKTIEQVIQEQLGALAFQNAALSAENERLKEDVAALQAQLADRPSEPHSTH